VARVFGHLMRQGRLPPEWIAGEIAALARPEGDIDTLMQRLAGIRVWSFVAQRSDWLADAALWQGRARETEDLLSEALHEKLMSRFVDRRSAVLLRRLEQGKAAGLLAAVTRRGEVIVEGHMVGVVGGFSFRPDPEATGADRRLVLRAARRALYAEMPRRVAALEAARDREFALAGTSILWEGAPLARLRRGSSALRPHVHVLASEFLDGPARERVRVRLQNFVDARIRADLAPLFAAEAQAAEDAALRGPMHLLCEGLGVVPGPAREDFPPAMRARLRPLGVRAGRFALFMPALLKPAPLRLRALLWTLAGGLPEIPALPPPGGVVWRGDGDFAAAMGWLAAGPVGIRLDVAERVAGDLAASLRRSPLALPPALGARLGVKAAELPAVLRGLGFRLVPQAGEAAPLIAHLRRRPAGTATPAQGALPLPAGPFASLAVLHRR
jgi:ATP-dependent RNA helicase SUPV3L1/SUV3